MLRLSVLSIIGACHQVGKSAGGNALHVKSATTGQKNLAIKSGFAFPVTKSFTDVNGKITTASAYNVYLANYDLDAKNFAMTLDKPLTADDQVRVVFSLIGDEGTNDKSPMKAATYSAKADKYDKAESAGIVARKSGADVKSWLDRSMLDRRSESDFCICRRNCRRHQSQQWRYGYQRIVYGEDFEAQVMPPGGTTI